MKSVMRVAVLASVAGLAMLGACQESVKWEAAGPSGETSVAWQEAKAEAVSDAALYPAENPVEVKLENQLDTTVSELVCEQQGLAKVLGFLADTQKINIQVNWKALEGAGIDKNTPVTVNLHNVRLRRLLEAVLSEASGAAANLAIAVDENIVMVSTRDELNSWKYLVMRTYSLDGLLPRPKMMPPVGAQGMTPGGGGWNGEGGGGGGGLFTDMGGVVVQSQFGRTHDEMVRDIIGSIQMMVDPDSWRDNGGTIGSMKEINGQLFVNQTKEAQRKVAAHLRKLREAITPQIQIDAVLVVVDGKTLEALHLGSMPHALTPAQAEKVSQILASSSSNRILSTPHVTLHDGQAISMVSGQARRLAGGYNITETAATTQPTAARTDFVPNEDELNTGLTLSMSAVCSRDHVITLYAAPAVAHLESMDRTMAFSPKDNRFVVDHPAWSNTSFATTVVLPAGQSALLGGNPMGPLAEEKVGAGPRYLFLLIRPSLAAVRATTQPATQEGSRR